MNILEIGEFKCNCHQVFKYKCTEISTGKFLIPHLFAQQEEKSVVDKMRECIDAPNNRTHVEHKSGNSALGSVDIDPGSSDVVVEVEYWHVAHLETVVVVGVLVGLGG